jgi:hypothetical protein
MDIKAFYIVVVALVAGCSSPATRVLADATSHALPAKAVIDVSDVREAIEIEKQTDANSGSSAPEGTQWFEILEGSTPVIVTAPHATKPFREGQYRFADGGGTAALAKMLNKLAGVTVVYTTFANFYDDNEFKAAVDTLISSKRPIFFLDLHGSNAYRPYDVDLGTMNGKSLLGQDAPARPAATLEPANVAETCYAEALSGDGRMLARACFQRDPSTFLMIASRVYVHARWRHMGCARLA